MSLAINDRVMWSPGEPAGIVISMPYKKYGQMVVKLMTGGPYSREWPVAQCRKVGTTWQLDLDCGTTVQDEFEGYPPVRVFHCPCGSGLACEVQYRRIIEEK